MKTTKDGAVLEKVAVDVGVAKNIKTYQNTVNGIALPLNERSATADTIKGGVEVNTNNKLYCNSDGTILDIDSVDNGTLSVVDPFNDNSGVALYQLDGNANDTGGNYNGTATGVTYGVGKFEQGMQLSKDLVLNAGANTVSSGYSISSAPLNNKTAASMSCWIKRPNSADPTIVLGVWFNGGQRQLSIVLLGTDTADYYGTGGTINANSIRVWCAGNVNTDILVSTPYTAPVGTFFNFTWVFNGATTSFEFFVNGVSVGSVSNPAWTKIPDVSANTASTNLIAIGNSPYTGVSGGDIIDQVRIFNKALTADEVNILYNENDQVLDITSNNLSNPPTNILIKPNISLESAITSDKQASKTYIADIVDTETIDYTTGEYKTTYTQQIVTNPDRMLVHKITADLNTQVNSIETKITT